MNGHTIRFRPKDSKVTSAVPKSTTFTLRVEKLRRVHCFFSFLVGKKGISDKDVKEPTPLFEKSRGRSHR